MYKYSLFLLVSLFLPALAFAAEDGTLQILITSIGGFLNNVIIPFILAIAFIVFVVNAVRYFVIGGATDDGQKNAKNLAVYGIAAFVFILSFWGLVNLLVDGVGLATDPCIPTFDYQERQGTSCPEPTATESDPGDFGVGVPGFPPGGGVVGPQNPTGPGVTLPGPDTQPTMPLPTAPIESFGPDGSPFGATLAVIESVQTEIVNQSAEYLANGLYDDFGYNAETVRDTLLLSVFEPTSVSNSYLDQATAAYRLNELGAISTALLNSYITAINAHTVAIGDLSAPLTIATLNANQEPFPSSLVAKKNETRALLEAELALYTSQNQAATIVASIYDQPIVDFDEMEDIMFDVYFSGGEYPAFLSPTGGDSSDILQRFIDDLNSEKTFLHIFELIE